LSNRGHHIYALQLIISAWLRSGSERSAASIVPQCAILAARRAARHNARHHGWTTGRTSGHRQSEDSRNDHRCGDSAPSHTASTCRPARLRRPVRKWRLQDRNMPTDRRAAEPRRCHGLCLFSERIDFPYQFPNGDNFRVLGSLRQSDSGACDATGTQPFSRQFAGNKDDPAAPSQEDKLVIRVFHLWHCAADQAPRGTLFSDVWGGEPFVSVLGERGR